MYLHPAFTNFDTQGIWIGKFEPSYNEETFIDSSKFLSVNPNYALATNPKNLIIKPNVRSLSNKTVSEFHTLIYIFSNSFTYLLSIIAASSYLKFSK